MAYTVQNAPFPFRQLNMLYGYVLAVLSFFILGLIRMTVKVSYHGTEHLKAHPNRIYAFWHENLPIHFVTNLRIEEPQIWLQHPMLFMKPVHPCRNLDL